MIYLDNAATTRPHPNAVKGAEAAITTDWFNPSALYAGGLEVRKAVNKAREEILSRVADFSCFELIFTSCGTEANNQAIFGGARRGNFVTTAGEHAAVYESAVALKNRGVEVRIAPVNADGSVKTEELMQLVDENTSLVSVIHVGNETGAVNNVFEIARRVKQKNSRTLFHSDGVQAFGKIPVRLDKNIDMYTVSAHKIGGFKGTGALVKRKNLNLPAYIIGGGQESNKRSGTENVPGIFAFACAAAEKFASLDADSARIAGYREELWSALDKSLFTRISPENGSPYILTVSAKGVRGEVLQRVLSDRGVYVGTGSACSSKHPFSRVIEACGYEKELLYGVLRFSFSPQTTAEEVQTAAGVVNEAARALYGRLQ